MNSVHNKVAVLMLQPACNMHCDYCVIEENFTSFTFVAAKELLLQLHLEGYTNVILGGGEPTTWRGHVFELAKVAKAIGFFVQIGTNAIKLPTNFAKNKDIDRWIIPLDSSIESIHNQLRHYKESHFKIINTVLESLANESRPVLISTVITTKNKDSLDKMVEYLNTYNQPKGNLESWNLYRLLPLGRGGFSNSDNLQIPESDFAIVVKELKEKNRNFKITVRKDMYSSQRVDFFVFQKGQAQKLEKNNIPQGPL